MRFKFSVIIALCFSLSWTVFAQGEVPGTGTPQGYLVGPGDELTGKVLGEEKFDFVATVDEDGRIEVPFFDKPLMVRCQTERQIRADVTKLLAKYLKYPQLSLRVTKRNSRPPVSVYGAVQKQQQFDLTRRVYLLEILSAAGGPTEKSGGMVQVYRTRPPMCAAPDAATEWKKTNGDALDIPSKMYSLAALRQGNNEANPEIFPGDIIIVSKASPVYVIGEVLRPGELDIPEGGLLLTRAIAMASGISREAKSKNVKIYRKRSGAAQPEVLAVNYDQIRKGIEKDVMLQPFDIVEVDKAKKSFGDILYDTLIGLPNRVPIPIL